ncbi:uncharacterized protein I206_100477 [Kwoniella pini CBS 10737]|uniref:Vacuolar membrane protein n=1 Tax=Kwoniella pini CBS 10737 TaxID=1296096 RepID=A0A1B9IDC4_9TREE|nr:uncharacterized protein I206_00851 [Kwoniella pini CBS 10737]OCF53546.1 hypothetical protein I206_00851 [Kwoniella pini CBS 10737]
MDRLPPSSPPPLPPHTDEDRCKLLGTTGLIVQAIMGVLVILSLVVKRQLEKRKRSWRIWVYDVGKQLAGQAVVHVLNVLISDVVAKVAHNNPCSLYFLNVLIDTTLGVGIIYFSLKSYTWYFSTYLAYDGFISGQYGHPPNPIFWCKQLAPYLMSIITMKILVLLPLTLPGISRALITWSHNMLDFLGPRGQVIFVMAIFPLVMNVVQFCLVDQVIKAGKDEDEDGDHDGSGGGGDYRRVREFDDHDQDGQDLESGNRPISREIGRNILPPSSARKESSASVVIPSSPLLTSNQRDYGSATPSPNGSPIKSKSHINEFGENAANKDNLWSKLINKVSDISTSTRSSSTVFFDAQTEIESNASMSVDNRDRLYVRDNRRGNRSSAPSPETLPSDASPSTTISTSPFTELGNHDQGVMEGEISPTVNLDLEGRKRYIPDELEREARLTLSPPASPTVDNLRNSTDSVGLKEVRGQINKDNRSE